jgi:RNA polymerase sigma factor (sigma-70 family)
MDDWSQIHEQYGSLVWATVYRILDDHTEALDCCQEIFLEVFGRTAPEKVRNWPAFFRWLATRRALDRYRKRRAEAAKFAADSDVASLTNSAFDVDAEASGHELMLRFKDELARLPEQQAEAIWLQSTEQMTYEEIAEQLGVEVNHVGVLLHRARKKLQQQLREWNPHEQRKE